MAEFERAGRFILRHQTGLTVAGLTAALMAVPVAVRNPYQLGILNLIALHVIAVLGLNLFIGYAGQISLGHAAFVGLGAYGSAVLTTARGVPPWPAMLLTAAAVALIAFIIGVPALRLAGHYLAMATLGFNYAVHIVFVQWDAVTGGPSGLSGVPPLKVGGFAFNSDLRFHFLAWGTAMLALGLCLNLVRSGVGRGLAALAQDETAAAAMGVNVRKNKVGVFVMSAVFASVAGSLYAHYFGYVNPDTFSIFASLDLVTMTVVGGLGSIWGSILGAGLITSLPHLLGWFEKWKDIIHGLILVVILVFLPQGLITGVVDRVSLGLARRRLAKPGEEAA